MNAVRVVTVIATLVMTGCADGEPEEAAQQPAVGQGAQVCQVGSASSALPDEVRETSGLARGRTNPRVFWTHNDAGNGAELFGLDAAGSIVQRVSVAGASSVDWEDIEAGPCDDGDCLYIGDIGDNDGERQSITVYVIAEPDAGATEAPVVAALHARFPQGPRDAEGLFVLPSGDVFIVTKGRGEAVELYRFPQRAPNATVTLERVAQLFPQPSDDQGLVGAATASPDGMWVGVRSYRYLYLYRAAELIGGAADPLVVDLKPLGHVQGESVAIGDDGSVWLTSEAERRGTQPVWSRIACTLPG
jgi:hypothetical protein